MHNPWREPRFDLIMLVISQGSHVPCYKYSKHAYHLMLCMLVWRGHLLAFPVVVRIHQNSSLQLGSAFGA